jgi:hypothetical protein
MLRSFALALLLASGAAAAQNTAPADPVPAGTSDVAPPADAPADTSAAPDAAAAATNPPPVPEADPSAKPNGPSPEQQRFEQYRRDLVNLLALRAEGDLLTAAAELAYPDGEDKARAASLKSPALIKRAQKYSPDDALVWWISTFLCSPTPGACQGEAATHLQQAAADNAAAWLPALHAAKDPGQARALLASMAQARRCDDFWAGGVLAVYRALQTLPVPAEVLAHGLNTTAARVNLATGVGGGFLPNYARLGEMCRNAESADQALTADCLAVARLLESGGSFRTQTIGFGIEDSLLPAGTARDVLRARQRSSIWQKQQFLELSARFPRDEALAQAYMDLLHEHGNELTTVTALLRTQHVPTDPPPGWQPPQSNPTAPADAVPAPSH